MVWQKYNCQSCHQLYGLGGYLGPDLTNVYSAKGKGELFIKAFLHAGTKQMPSFDLSKEEEKELKPNQENLMDHHIEKIKHEFYTYIYRTTMKNH